jgi:CelD/BcsL family acetyltransferase involved in cellulose biosynthesis
MTLARAVHVGDDALAVLDELAPFIDARSTTFCTSSAWLRAAARHLPGRPVVLTVRSGGRPVGVGALSMTTRRGVHRVELLGGDLNDYGQFYSDGEAAAAELADVLVTWLASHRYWSLLCGQMAEDDPMIGLLSGRLPGATVEQGPPMPQILGIGTDFPISRNRRHQQAKAINRIEGDGLRWEKVVVNDGPTLDRWLPQVIELRRQRDHAAGRRSHLDNPAMLEFYETVVRDFVSRGRAAIYLLAIEGQVAGFTLAMYDDGAHRVLDGRVADDLQRYRGGMLCNVMALTHAAEAQDVTTFDWLRGITEAKRGNHISHRVDLVAASHRAVVAIDKWEHSARQRIKAVLPAAAVRQLVER